MSKHHETIPFWSGTYYAALKERKETLASLMEHRNYVQIISGARVSSSRIIYVSKRTLYFRARMSVCMFVWTLVYVTCIRVTSDFQRNCMKIEYKWQNNYSLNLGSGMPCSSLPAFSCPSFQPSPCYPPSLPYLSIISIHKLHLPFRLYLLPPPPPLVIFLFRHLSSSDYLWSLPVTVLPMTSSIHD